VPCFEFRMAYAVQCLGFCYRYPKALKQHRWVVGAMPAKGPIACYRWVHWRSGRHPDRWGPWDEVVQVAATAFKILFQTEACA